MPTAVSLIALGAVLLALAVAGLRRVASGQRQPVPAAPAAPTALAAPVGALPESPDSAGVLMSEAGGRVLFANDRARRLFGLNGEMPTLGLMLRRAQPADSLLELLAAEGQAQLTIGQQRMEATSLRLPAQPGEADRLIVVLRDSEAGHTPRPAATGGPDASTWRAAAAINQAIAASLNIERTLDSLVTGLQSALHFDLLEVNLWDQAEQRLRPLRHAGDPDYPRELERAGAYYTRDQGLSGWLIRNRQPLRVGHVAANTPAAPKLAGPNFAFQSYLGVPLLIDDELVGTLELAAYAPEAFVPASQALLEIVAGQAATSIRNAQRYTRQQRQVAELAGLAEITLALEASADPDALYRRLTSDIARFMDVQIVGLMIHDPRANALVGQPPFFGMPDIVAQVFRLSLTAGSLADTLWRSGDPLLSAGVPTDARMDELGLRQLCETAGIQTAAWVPVGLPGQRHGLLQVANKNSGQPFTDDDVRLLSMFALQVAAILDNARLVRQAQARAEASDALRAIAAAAAEADPGTVLKLATDHLARLLGLDLAMVVLLDEARGELVPHPASLFGGGPQDILTLRLRTDDASFATAVTRTRRPFITGSALEDRRIQGFYRMLVDHFQVNSAMDAPLVAGNRAIGEMIVAAHRPRAFTRDDLDLLATVGAQVASAIERARLFAATDHVLQRRVDQLTALTRVSRELNQTLQLERILRLVHDEALHTTRADCGSIVLFDLDTPEAAEGTAPTVALRLGDEALGAQLTALEAEVAAGKRLPGRVNGLEAGSPLAAHDGVQAALIAPILAQDQVVGLMHLHSRQAEGFDQAAEDAALALASQMAIAVLNARRYEDQIRRSGLLRRRADQMAQLFEVSRSVRSDQPLAENLEAIAFGLQEAVGFDTVLVSVLEPRSRRLQRTAAAGLPLAAFETLRQVETPWTDAARLVGDDDRPVQSVILTREQAGQFGAHIGAPRAAHEAQDVAAADAWPAGGVLLQPLRGSGREVVGLLSADSPRDGRLPDRGTLEIVDIFANQAAQAIENARLFSAAQRRAAQLLALHRIMQAASLAANRQHIWQTVSDALLAEMRGPDVCLVGMAVNDGPAAVTLAGRAGAISHDIQFAPLLAADNPLAQTAASSHPQLELNAEQSGWALNPLLVALGVNSFVCVPILAQGRSAGALFIGARHRPEQPSPFSEEDLDVFTVLANQLGALLESAGLQASMQQQAEQLAALARVAQTITATLNSQDVAAAVLDGLADVLPYDSVSLWLRAGQQLRLVAARGFDDDTRRVGLSVDIADSVLFAEMDASLAPILVPEVRHDARFAAGEFQPTQSWLAAPLVSKGSVLGVLALDKAEANFYPPQSVAILMAFASQAAVALDNARLFDESQQRARQLDERSQRLALLNRVSAELSGTLLEDQILVIAMTEISSALSADQARMVALNSEGQPRLAGRLPAGSDEPGAGLAGVAAEALAHVRQTGAPLAIEDAAHDTLLTAARAELLERGVKSLLVAPLAVAGQVLAVLQIEFTSELRRFSPGEVELAQILANQAAVAVQNARFAGELEERVTARTAELERERQRVALLLQVTTELSSSLDLDRVLSRALELVSEAIGADRGSIYLVDMESDQLIYRAALGRATPLAPGGLPAPFKRASSLVGQVIKQREAAVIADVNSDPRWTALPDHDTPHRSALIVPLMVNEDALGAVVLLSPRVNAFDDDQARLVAAASNQVGAAINNAELYRLIRDQAERLGGMLRTQQVESTKSRAILEGIADGVMVADDRGTVILFNVACERILGLERDQVVGRPVSEFIGIYGPAGSGWAAAVDHWSRDPGSYNPGEFLDQRIFLDERKVISVHLAPVVAGDEYLGSVSVIRDISRDVEVDQLKSEFVTNVSHELRTPMTSIKGYADLLLMGAGGPLSDDQARFMEVIRSNADRLSLLLNDLLDISRIESGQVQLSMTALPIQEVIKDVLATLRGRIDEEDKPMNIQSEAEADLPPVWGDRQRLTQVLMNLANNAFNYTHAGGALSIQAAFDADSGQVVVEVTDSGLGIAPEDQPRLFDRFYRGEDALVLANAGTGLGLPIARQVMEMHGGRLWLARSEVGHGSTFAMAVPIAKH